MNTEAKITRANGKTETRNLATGGFRIVMQEGKKLIIWYDCLEDRHVILKPTFKDCYREIGTMEKKTEVN
jgi:hypothetical protein